MSEIKKHDLKIWSRHFEAVLSGRKKCEHRLNDREFEVGDTLLLREVTEPDSGCLYTGRETRVTVTHIIPNGEMVILSIEPYKDMDSVDSIPDDELLRRAVKSACTDVRRGYDVPRWVAVKETSQLGSTYASQLCRRFEIDPEELVRR